MLKYKILIKSPIINKMIMKVVFLPKCKFDWVLSIEKWNPKTNNKIFLNKTNLDKINLNKKLFKIWLP